MLLNNYLVPDTKQVIRCHQKRFDQALCPFNQVSNVIRVYVGKLQYTSQCTSRHDDCSMEIKANNYQNIYNTTIHVRYCDGRSACTQGLFQSSVTLYHCETQNVRTDYMVIEYTCVQLTTGNYTHLASKLPAMTIWMTIYHPRAHFSSCLIKFWISLHKIAFGLSIEGPSSLVINSYVNVNLMG